MIEQYRGAPSWPELSRVGTFVIERTNETASDTVEQVEGVDPGGERRARVDRALALVTTVGSLCAAPTARFRAAAEAAHVAVEDSAKRRASFTVLTAMADVYRTHPDWNRQWDPQSGPQIGPQRDPGQRREPADDRAPHGQWGPTADYGG